MATRAGRGTGTGDPSALGDALASLLSGSFGVMLLSPNAVTSRVVDPRVTEQRNPRTQQIDLADPLGIVDLMGAGLGAVAA